MKDSFYDNYVLAEDLAEKIMRCYEKYNVFIHIRKKDIHILKNSINFKIKLRSGTRATEIKKYEKDVQICLKLHLFQVVQDDINIFIIASKQRIVDCKWNHVLYDETMRDMKIAHFIGFSATGNAVIKDLALYPHILLAGTTGSGKSVALKNLLVGILYRYSPARVNLLIGDMAGDLQQFEKIPHLAYPVIRDFDSFYCVMKKLKEEMERRIDIKGSKEYSQMPYIIFVIDEFTSFIDGMDAVSKAVRGVIMEILRRGRHAKIHMVLTVHNPTKQRLKIDLSDIPTKMVFRVARLNNSVSILGAGGAEKLAGNGEMLFQSSQSDEIQRIQGADISNEDVMRMLEIIRFRWGVKNFDGRLKFHIIPKEDMASVDCEKENEYICPRQKGFTEESVFAKSILWGISQDTISCNLLMKKFGVGWNRANDYLNQMYKLGLVGNLDAKLPRKVLVKAVKDVPEEVIQLLFRNGISRDVISNIFEKDKPTNV